MPGPTPRDLLKTRDQRVGETEALAALKAGQANGQALLAGGVLAVDTVTQKFTIGDTYYMLAGVRKTKLAQLAIVLNAGAITAAGQFMKVLIELDGSGTVVQTLGAIAGSQGAALLPALTPANFAVGWIEIPASFTAGTTAITAGMLKLVTWDAG